MARLLLPALAFVLTMTSWSVPTTAQSLPQELPAVLKTHGHPQKDAYASRAEWPDNFSMQTHWQDPSMTSMAHTGHVECRGPWYAEIPRAPFSLDCQIQMFHVSGGLWSNPDGSPYGMFGHAVSRVEWQRFGMSGERIPDNSPVVGDPKGVVVRPFRIWIDPALTFPNGSGGDPLVMPENGWFHINLVAYFKLSNGTMPQATFTAPLYIKGDPKVPETPGGFGYQFKTSSRSAVSAVNSGNLHGESIAEFVVV